MTAIYVSPDTEGRNEGNKWIFIFYYFDFGLRILGTRTLLILKHELQRAKVHVVPLQLFKCLHSHTEIEVSGMTCNDPQGPLHPTPKRVNPLPAYL